MSKEDLIDAREAARLLLDRVGLANYLFEVKADEGGWSVLVEHPRDGAWHRVTLAIAGTDVRRTLDDPRHRGALAARWRERLYHRRAA